MKEAINYIESLINYFDKKHSSDSNLSILQLSSPPPPLPLLPPIIQPTNPLIGKEFFIATNYIDSPSNYLDLEINDKDSLLNENEKRFVSIELNIDTFRKEDDSHEIVYLFQLIFNLMEYLTFKVYSYDEDLENMYKLRSRRLLYVREKPNYYDKNGENIDKLFIMKFKLLVEDDDSISDKDVEIDIYCYDKKDNSLEVIYYEDSNVNLIDRLKNVCCNYFTDSNYQSIEFLLDKRFKITKNSSKTI